MCGCGQGMYDYLTKKSDKNPALESKKGPKKVPPKPPVKKPKNY